MPEIVERKFKGDKVKFDIWRNKTKQTVVRQTPTPGRFFSHVASALQLYQSEGICFRAGLIVVQVEHT